MTLGQGVLLAKRTGTATRLGRIGLSLASIEPEETTLQKNTRRIVVLFALLGLGFCLAVVLAYGLMRGNWIEAGLAGITPFISTRTTVFASLAAGNLTMAFASAAEPGTSSLRQAAHRLLDHTGRGFAGSGDHRLLFRRSPTSFSSNSRRRLFSPQD